MPREDDGDLKAEPTAAKIRMRWDDGEDDTAEACRAWWVNDCYIQGEQWIRWDRQDRVVLRAPRDLRRDRIVINRIRPAMNSLMGRLTGKPLRFESKPTAADDATVQGARLAENLLNTTHDEQDWEAVRAREIRDAYRGGVSAVFLDWDASKGQRLEYDESTERVVGTGDIVLCALPITDFRLAPGVRDGYASPWWISGIAMSQTEAMRRYHLPEKPEADALLGKSNYQKRLLSNAGRAAGDSCLVLTYWQPPGPDWPGYVATVIGGEIVDGPHPWPFPFEDLNLALFNQDETDVWTGSTSLNDVIGPQHAYNCVWSANIEAARLAGTPYLAVDQLSYDLIDDDLTDEPGKLLQYAAGSNPPNWVVPPGPTRGLREMIAELDRVIDDSLANHGVSRGDVNVNRTPAASIAQLAEKDDTPLGRFAHSQSAGWARLARLVLLTYEAKATEKRTTAIMAQGETVATMQWDGKMLRGQTNVTVPLEVTKPFSRVAARQSAIELAGLAPPGTLPLPKLLELWDIDPEDSLEVIEPDVAKAKRENVKMLAGVECVPAPFDDHRIHISELNAFRKTAAYEQADPQVQMIFDMHAMAHEQLEAQQLFQQMERNAQLMGSANVAQADAPPLSRVPAPFAQRQGSAPMAPPGVAPMGPTGP